MVIHVNKHTHEGGMIIKPIKEKRDALKALTQEEATQALAQFEQVDHLKQPFEMAQSTLNSLENKISLLKDEIVATFVRHFEKGIRHVTFLYLDLDLSLMDPF